MYATIRLGTTHRSGAGFLRLRKAGGPRFDSSQHTQKAARLQELPAPADTGRVAASEEPLGQKSASGNQWAADADFVMFISREQSAERDPRLLVASNATPQMSGMGRFATTAPLYEQFRPPYFPEFFRTVAQKQMLGRQHALIDLGTGPGLIALGLHRTWDESSASIRSLQCLRQQKGPVPAPD
ncbi:hypothetical protein [Bradyrhizobium sp. ISRA463]|uniref:hypothetical protein n=1 Tax=Bradyrhizobium sp. ISRA463 TaxID=2866199 RepID=UPI00247B0283|nr:hypothetical protein [Bradyrhizobium sp. ISRA463]WGS22991.1 hypothetical protein MTX22_15900 [Bradyrhizobium sp. ISRA463]